MQKIETSCYKIKHNQILSAQVDPMKAILRSKNYLGEAAELDTGVGVMSEGRCASA